jgi:hypothetical protein
VRTKIIVTGTGAAVRRTDSPDGFPHR